MTPGSDALTELVKQNGRLQSKVWTYEQALRVIRGPWDDGPLMEVYRTAGGGYAGLQAIAEFALKHEGEA